MSIWEPYPSSYRAREIAAIEAAVRAGSCASLVGLSGAGKSNLLGFLAWRAGQPASPPGLPRMLLLDCNRLSQPDPAELYRLACRRLSTGSPPDILPGEALETLRQAIEASIDREGCGLCLLLDRFDRFGDLPGGLAGQLRSLRDDFKYQLTYVIGSRRPLDAQSELAELFYAHTFWLGPLAEPDARWSIGQYARRCAVEWDEETVTALYRFSTGYPALLRAVCEAVAAGCSLDLAPLADHPAVQARLVEFWADHPGREELRLSGLLDLPLLMTGRPFMPDRSQLTAKEGLLLEALCAHPDQVCPKDDLIRAVWPEDRVFETGIRDDSLAQLIRRLREKVEPNPADPRFILTVPGRGYKFKP